MVMPRSVNQVTTFAQYAVAAVRYLSFGARSMPVRRSGWRVVPGRAGAGGAGCRSGVRRAAVYGSLVAWTRWPLPHTGLTELAVALSPPVRGRPRRLESSAACATGQPSSITGGASRKRVRGSQSSGGVGHEDLLAVRQVPRQ